MKRRKIIISILLSCVVVAIALRSTARVDGGFATSAIIKYHYMDSDIEIAVTDEADLAALKSLLSGFPRRDSPSCGFSADISITLTDGNNELVFCPACDGDPVIRIGEGDRYMEISDEARSDLDVVVGKYGMTFPCL